MNIEQLFQLSAITSSIQLELGESLIEPNPELNDKLKKCAESDIQEVLEEVVQTFVGAMPLANIQGINLYMQVLGYLGGLKPESGIVEAIKKINSLTIESKYN